MNTLLKPGADDRNDIVFVSFFAAFLFRFRNVFISLYDRFSNVSTYERVYR